MSRAHDNLPVYPDNQGTKHIFEDVYEEYRLRIRHYLALKVNPMAADDLTQQVFIKVMENLDKFNRNSSLFTWIFKIAQNTVKNEYRSISRKHEMPYDFTSYESQSISLDFARYVDIRIDIGAALKQLSELDQQIISLRFFVDCTLSEISKIVGMRESAVKNRLYRALEKLKKELKEWGDITMMSILDLISIESKSEGSHRQSKVHEDLFQELKNNVEQITAKYKHQPSSKIVIEIYPDLPTFHQAVGEVDAPDWFMGTFDNNILKIVSPLNPGPEHTYQSILRSTLHLYTMWLISDINPLTPKWIRQGIGGYEAQQMSRDFIRSTTSEAIRNGTIPSFEELNDHSWEFGKTGFQFSYLIIEYITKEYGLGRLNQFIRNLDDYHGIFHLTKEELHRQWVEALQNQLI
ncbi:RNA polymerase sigma factor [Paenibacillus solani]|uniref:RNA polymerase sigma factor n=1 Tax=Paenibacillus solani TaxID=1705565 RepID=A0A0M1P4Q8_9BACL|nr:sigma-70 family RNA polymerase sigma factor [Paenibacillus solani]KOR89029.1 RNA polymerase subunit sigma-24 [Paenibacillus solani]